MTRDDVQEQFGAAPDDGGPSDRMADEIVRLRSILAALQPVGDVLLRYYNMEASEDEVYAVFCAWRTATSPVAASEREVSG